MSIDEEAQDLIPELRRWRRYLHQHPELSFQEFETQSYLVNELTSLGLTPKKIARTGIYVDIGTGEPTVAIRADIDALPLSEEWQGEFASQNSGIMHACGHDGHTAMLLGVAHLLATRAQDLPGAIRLMFQPAEELIPGGAKLMIAEGVLAGIQRVLGLHLTSDYPSGMAFAFVGAQTANADAFRIFIEGRGGHGSMPHKSLDALVIAAQLVTEAQTIVSRAVDPMMPAVLTFGTLHAGSNFNIIAPRAELTGTIRTYGPESRDIIFDQLTRLNKGLSQFTGAEIRMEYDWGYPSVVNTPQETRVVQEIVSQILGEHGWQDMPPTMVGEDFSYYLQQCPGTFFMLGCGNPDVNATYPHHHPRFTFDEQVMPWGSAILTESALRFLSIAPTEVPWQSQM